MKSIYDIISERNNDKIDGHIHLFDKDNCLLQYKEFSSLLNSYNINKFVGFVDIEPKYINSYNNTVKLYDTFIKEYYNPNQHILLASSTNIDNLTDLYNKYSHIFKGFGEIKCYDTHKGVDINNKKVTYLKDICELSQTNNNIPVYIHYSLTSKRYIKLFENLLKQYPLVPIVLCHCGMENEKDLSIKREHNNDFIYTVVCELMKKYPNLWLDISYVAADYFVENTFRLYNMDLDRVIIGTDLNPVLYKNNMETIIKYNVGKYNTLSINIDNTKNVNKLFKI